MDYLIWWTNQDDCDVISESKLLIEHLDPMDGGVERYQIAGLPDYIDSEFWSRLDRSGRNRLWIHESLNLPSSFGIAWDTKSNGAKKLAWFNYGGIVIKAEDKGKIIHLPGIITDLQLRLVGE